MTSTTYAHCITGRPPTRVLCRGAALVRGDVIEHRDGTRWRYEGMTSDNAAIYASPIPGTGVPRRFTKDSFGIDIVAGGDADLSVGMVGASAMIAEAFT